VNQVKSLFDKDQYWTFDKFIEIEKSHNIRSTVFFLNESMKFNLLKLKTYKLALGRYSIYDKKIQDIIQWLDHNGWEIGVHGSYNSYLDKTMLYKEKKELEKVVGHQITGVRQHYLNLISDTWAFQNEVGFKYDSSWGYTNAVGFKEEKYVPFHPLNNAFSVFPLVLMDTCFMKTENKWNELERILDLCEKKDAVLVINFHQHVFNKYDFPGYKEAYIEIINRCKKRNACFYTLNELYNKML